MNIKTEVTRKQSTNKATQIFRKTSISYPLIRLRTCTYQVVRNVCFSEILPCFVFSLPPSWDSPFCLSGTDMVLSVSRHVWCCFLTSDNCWWQHEFKNTSETQFAENSFVHKALDDLELCFNLLQQIFFKETELSPILDLSFFLISTKLPETSHNVYKNTHKFFFLIHIR